MPAAETAGDKNMQVNAVIEYVTTGKANISRAQIARLSESPLLADNARVQAIRRLDPSFGDSAVCLVRWLFEGAPHVFSDFDMGRNIRRITSNREQPSMTRLWEELPTACRKCSRSATVFGGTYTEAITFGSAESMAREFEAVIERAPVVPGVTFFCSKCRSVAAISFEYDRALRTALLLPQQFETAGGYYVSIAANHRAKKNCAKTSLLKEK
jgi:hypothetical protein